MLKRLLSRPAPAIPDWDRLRLVVRRSEHLRAVHLCLLLDERPVGWSSVRRRDDGTTLWLDRPVGPDWALDLLNEAVEEWRREDGPPVRRSTTAAVG
jgi:hypothetical protein